MFHNFIIKNILVIEELVIGIAILNSKILQIKF
jgi:hypothetical protein